MNMKLDIQDELRNIYLIKPEYLNLVIQDIERLMPVKPGSTQYVSDDLYKVTTSDCIHKKVIGVKIPGKNFPR